MKAWLIDGFDGIDKLRLGEAPDPKAGPGEVGRQQSAGNRAADRALVRQGKRSQTDEGVLRFLVHYRESVPDRRPSRRHFTFTAEWLVATDCVSTRRVRQSDRRRPMG